MTWLLYNVNSVVITLAHAYAPFAILPIFVALEKIDRSFLEAGRDLGESPFMTFLRVTLPLAMPGVISSVLIVFIPTIGDYVTPSLVGGPEGKMVANLIELNYKKLDNYPLGSALAISSMALGDGGQPVVFVYEPAVLEGEQAMKGGWFRGYTIAYLIFLYAPIVLLPIFAFNNATTIAFPLNGFTTEWFGKLWDDPALHHGAEKLADHWL